MNKLMILVLVLTVFLATAAPLYDVIEDIERSYTPMQLGEIWAKLGRGETLMEQEINFLRLQGNLVQNTTAITSGWIGADQQPHVETVYAKSGVFRVPPVGGSLFMESTVQAVANTTVVALVANDHEYYTHDSVLIPYGTTGDKWVINPIVFGGLSAIRVTGHCDPGVIPQTAAYHVLAFEAYLKSDNSLVGGGFSGPGLYGDSGNWAAKFETASFDGILSRDFFLAYTTASWEDVYFQMTMYHNKGSSIDMLGCSLYATRIQ